MKNLKGVEFCCSGFTVHNFACMFTAGLSKVFEGVNFSHRSTNHENSVEVFD